MAVDLVSSLLLGSALSSIISPYIIKIFGINFFSSLFSKSIPSLTSDIITGKNLDLVDFVLTLILSSVIFLANYLAGKKSAANKIFAYWYLVFAFLIFLQTHFVFTSGSTLIAFVAIIQPLYLFIKLKQIKLTINFDWQILANGLFLGFYLLLLANKATAVPAGLLFLLISVPFLYIGFNYLNPKLFKSPGHLTLLIALFNPLSIAWLVFVGLIAAVLVIFIRRSSLTISEYLYPLAVIFLFAYNPLFYVGNFDSVEEGFWSAWNQRLFTGQVPYRDFLAYHPPLLMWALNIFSYIFGFTLRSQKLFFHLLQITGLTVFYFLSRPLISKPLNRILFILAAISFSGTLVSNNFEIRLGFGLLAILFWYTRRPILSGIFTATALFTSLEVGLVTLTVLSSAHYKNISKYLLGFFVISVPIIAYLWLSGAIGGFLSQLYFYSKAFSSGYFNSPIDRQFQSAYLHWHIFNQYVSSDNPVLWEIVKLIIFGSFLFSGLKIVTKQAAPHHQLIFIISIFSLGLFRSALGRSDYYHLLPLVWLSLLLTVHYLEKYSVLVLVLILVIFVRNPINANYLENYLYRLQTYARPIGEWRHIASSRSGLELGQNVDTYTLNDMLDHISANTQAADRIFVYPWNPEIYFLANRPNSTALDTPYAFFTDSYQQQIISQLRTQPPKLIIYNSQKYFGNMKPESMPLLTNFIVSNFPHVQATFGNYKVLTP